jgi:hypothetical protein
MNNIIPTGQELFVERIKLALHPGISLVNELADLLEVSTDSAYRRIRGETSFSLEEIITVCNHYKISFDAFCSNSSGSVNFSYELLANTVDSFQNYLNGMLADMQRISASTEKEIIYAAEDIPLFHLFRFPELAAFKVFYWMKSVLNIPELEGKNYDPSLIDESIMETGKNILELYTRIPCKEIWSERTISSLVKQIDYYNEAGFFNRKEDALHLCDIFSEALLDIKTQAEKTTKATVAGFENNFILYNSDIEIGNNCILVKAGGTTTVYLRHHTFNSMITQNASFCSETEQWFSGLIKKSSLISGVSEKQRNQYFRKALESVEMLKNRL